MESFNMAIITITITIFILTTAVISSIKNPKPQAINRRNSSLDSLVMQPQQCYRPLGVSVASINAV